MKVLRLPEVLDRVGFRRSKVYALIAAGQFPRPIALSTKTRGFLENEIDDWIQQRVDESRKPR